MDHSYEHHIDVLNKLCRICGYTISSKSKKKTKIGLPRLCADIQSDIYSVIEIDISNDIEGKHAKSTCSRCVKDIKTCLKTNNHTKSVLAKKDFLKSKSENIWCSYDERKSCADCSVCDHYSRVSKGRRTTKNQHSEDKENASININDSLDDIPSLDQHLPPPPCHIGDSTSLLNVIQPDNCVIGDKLSSRSYISQSESDPTVDDILHAPLDAPFSPKEEALLTALVKRKLNATPKGIKCTTNGKPIHLFRVIAPQTPTVAAKPYTLKKRARQTSEYIKFCEGPSVEASDKHIETLLKQIPKKRRDNICRKANVKQKARISKHNFLLIKEGLNISWSKTRVLRKLLKRDNIVCERENSVREYAKQLHGDFVKAGNHMFYDENGISREYPYGFIKDLPQFVDQLLDSYEKHHLLTWHEGVIPSDQIWIKFGGDHGKKSLKFTLEVANTKNPNSNGNTVVIAKANVKDTYDNLVRFLEQGIGEEIIKLCDHSWKGKQIKLYLNGDYEFLCKSHGLSGAQGTHPCLFCDISKKCLQPLRQSRHALRTLDDIKSDHLDFLETGKGDKDEVKHFKNCLRFPIFMIPISSIVPPYLHILLGIVVKHHRLLESAAHKLDLLIQKSNDQWLTKNGKRIKKHGANWRVAEDLEKQITFERACSLDERTSEEHVQIQYQNRLSKLERQLEQLPHRELDHREGPIASKLDCILETFRIIPQAYHSRSFIGNHCHNYLKLDVCQTLTKHIVDETTSLTGDPFIVDESYQVKHKFDYLNECYKDIHLLISHTRPISPESCPDIQRAINKYMRFFRRNFPKKVIPKQHLLEHHCVPFIHETGLGLGLLGEQGTENSHQHIAKIEQRASGILNKVTQLKYVLNTHLVQQSPEIQAGLESTRTQKKKKDISTC